MIRVLTLMFLAFVAFSCAEPTSQASGGPATKQNEGQKLATKQIKVGTKSIRAEIADEENERMTGLMFRTKMPENEGMLFIFENERVLAFWMKNTRIPLTIAYADRLGKIVDIQDMEPASEMDMNPRTYPSAQPAQFALEMNKGWFKKNGVNIGDKIQLP